MGPLSNEWQPHINYFKGDRVAFKVGDTPGAQAFESTRFHTSSTENKPDPNDTTFWRHFPRGFPNEATPPKVSQPKDKPEEVPNES